MNRKKGYSLLEMIFVLIILSLVVGITSNIIIDTSKRYLIQYKKNYLNLEIDNDISILKTFFKNTVYNTIIGDKCNIDNDDCYNGKISDFKSYIEITNNNEQSKYPVIEFMNENNYFYNIWNNDKKRNVQLSSKFVDLKKTIIINSDNNEYNITVPYSNFDNLYYILNQYNKDFGKNEDQSKDSNTVLLMSGINAKGDILDINNSYGWNKTSALKLFKIKDRKHIDDSNIYNEKDILNIKTIDNINGITTEPFETFFIINSATALIPKKNDNGLLDFYISILYKPWKKETYKDGKYFLLFKNVSKLKFYSINNKIYVQLCLKDNSITLSNNKYLEVCKEIYLK